VFLAGARLNWILHFGMPPRFSKDVKIIQLDKDAHEINTNLKADIPLVGEAAVVLEQLTEAIQGKIVED
jgi:2-hydroxyacyl-CoA lyase 1